MSASGDRELHLVAYTDATELGGAEHCLRTILTGLAPRFRVTVVGPDAALLAQLCEGRGDARQAQCPSVSGYRDLVGIARLARLLRRLRPDVCHVNLRTPYAAQYGLVAAHLCRVPTVAVEHLPLASTSGARKALKRWTSTRLREHVAVGEATARFVERDADLAPGSIRVVHNGVPAATTAAAPALAPAPVVGGVGRLDRQKGFDVLVAALPRLPGATAVLVGDGPERVALELLADRLGVRDRVLITGWRDDVSALLRSFDALALPSRYEGLPLVLLEALAAGLPVVTTGVGSILEAVTDGEDALVVPVDDPDALAGALARVLGDPALAAGLGARAVRTWAERFDAAAMVRAYSAIYERLAA